MRISSTFAVLAAMLILGVSVAGETTSTGKTTSTQNMEEIFYSDATTEELEKEFEDYVQRPGEEIDPFDAANRADLECDGLSRRQTVVCLMDWVDEYAYNRGKPLPPWTQYY
ncbi:hypothetical protein LRAMOSA09067 [Lichtheimia ramosa]|uniref:Uncharacterized protein n=1 Tax=Lichtheimia ramosa TaxID=688394 RepID=A0A077WHB5_9FUNG|nr:hypothetical protein LRAMOSA09067 [Lichtheimia ramosa]